MFFDFSSFSSSPGPPRGGGGGQKGQFAPGPQLKGAPHVKKKLTVHHLSINYFPRTHDFPVFETSDFKIFPGEHIPLEDEKTKLSKSNFAPDPQMSLGGPVHHFT